jgi:hypothetical protein
MDSRISRSNRHNTRLATFLLIFDASYCFGGSILPLFFLKEQLGTNNFCIGLSQKRFADECVFDAPSTSTSPTITFLVKNAHVGLVGSFKEISNRLKAFAVQFNENLINLHVSSGNGLKD